jgi:hypothetical protein
MNLIEANRHHIEAALEYSGGTHVYEDVEAAILSGRMQLWPGSKSMAVTEIVEYPRKRVLNCFLAAGDMDEIVDMISSAAAWGRAQGCESLTLSGRKGWERVLSPHGFKPVMLTMELLFSDRDFRDTPTQLQLRA